MTFADINDLGRGIYGVLAFSEYLTAAYDADSMSYRLPIPNREMYGVFSERILDRLEGTMSAGCAGSRPRSWGTTPTASPRP